MVVGLSTSGWTRCSWPRACIPSGCRGGGDRPRGHRACRAAAAGVYDFDAGPRHRGRLGQGQPALLAGDWRGYVEFFFAAVLEPHSTKQQEDASAGAMETTAETLLLTRRGRRGRPHRRGAEAHLPE